MKKIYQAVKSKNIQIKHVCEVGVYLPETSNVIDFIKDNVKTTLVEADPVIIEKIKNYFADRKNIELVPVAVWDTNGTLQFSKAQSSTFATEIGNSPAVVNDKFKVEEHETFEVPCKVFSEIDAGDIDLLSVDTEGCEWYVIKHLKSKPKVISIETHGKFYVNPFIKEIEAWTNTNGYVVWYKDGSDTVFVQNSIYTPSFLDKLSLWWRNFRLAARRLKKHFR